MQDSVILCQFVTNKLIGMFDIVMYRGVNTALITTITWVILRIVMGEVVCATEATHIIGQHNPLVFAAMYKWPSVLIT